MTDADSGGVIAFDDVGKKFDETWVLEDMTFEVPAARIVGLIGPSGSGKTTTVRLATGFHRPDAGSVTILGTEPADLAGSQRSRIGYLPQHPVLFETLSLRDNLHFHASLNGVRFSRKERLAELVELVDLAGDERKLVSEASGGMKRRLALAGALVHDPDVVLLDEPTAGIDPILRRRFWEHFRSVRNAGRTFVISTQFVDEAANCDEVAMLAHGRIAAMGTPEQLLEQSRDGTLFDLEFDHDVTSASIREMRNHADVIDVTRGRDRMVAMTIRRGGPTPSEVCESIASGVQAIGVSERPPDWDEVFISLVGDDASDDVSSKASSGTPE